MLIATPLGVALAIGLARWRGRGARPANFLMLFPLVTPEIVMGVALFLVFVYLFGFIQLGTQAQLLGHVTFTISYVVIIVRGRLFAVGREYEEAAMDLGASQWQAIRMVLLPMLAPAIWASLMIAFAISIDDFVITAFLMGDQPPPPSRSSSTAPREPPRAQPSTPWPASSSSPPCWRSRSPCWSCAGRAKRRARRLRRRRFRPAGAVRKCTFANRPYRQRVSRLRLSPVRKPR